MIWKALKYFLYFCVICGIIGAITDNGGSSRSTRTIPQEKPAAQAPQSPQYKAVDIVTMMEELNNNAAAAQRKYKGQYLAVTGQIGVIDSNGDYIALLPDEYSITGIRCDVNRRDTAQEDFVFSVSRGQIVTACGKVTDVGEIFGYSMKVDYFK